MANYYQVPLKRLNSENAQGMGVCFTTFEDVEIDLCRWPTQGKRPLISVGGYGAVLEEEFKVYWRGSTVFSAGHQNARGGATGKIVSDPKSQSKYVLLNWLSAHLDAGEALMPKNGEPSIFLVAPPKEDVKPEDFVALYSDGSCGISMHAGVWHTAPLSLSEKEVVYQRKQGSIYATIDCLLLKEHNTWLKIPLRQPEAV
ncbi:ureidoglycolate lyase [Dapis sp. BLCC M229]|uniref:ureidoglycolate lyase n=1 Tax=Dapis sp. BLCC M229 TaxID=3400188 RepID=UPI003CEB2503